LTLAQNQRLALMCALLERDQWPRVYTMLQRMPEFYPFATSTHVIDAASQLLNRRLEISLIGTLDRLLSIDNDLIDQSIDDD